MSDAEYPMVCFITESPSPRHYETASVSSTSLHQRSAPIESPTSAATPRLCSRAARESVLLLAGRWYRRVSGALTSQGREGARKHPSHALIPMGGWCASAAAVRNRATTVRTRRRLRRLSLRCHRASKRCLYLLTGGWLMGGTVNGSPSAAGMPTVASLPAAALSASSLCGRFHTFGGLLN